MWSRLVCQSLGIESFSADTSPRRSNRYVNRSRCVRTTLDDRLSYSGTIDKNRRTIDHATVRNELEKLGWRVSNVVVSTAAQIIFQHCDYTLVFSFSLRVRGGSAEVALLEINHLSSLKAWLVSVLIILENLETFQVPSTTRSSYQPTNLEGIIKRNGIIKR